MGGVSCSELLVQLRSAGVDADVALVKKAAHTAAKRAHKRGTPYPCPTNLAVLSTELFEADVAAAKLVMESKVQTPHLNDDNTASVAALLGVDCRADDPIKGQLSLKNGLVSLALRVTGPMAGNGRVEHVVRPQGVVADWPCTWDEKPVVIAAGSCTRCVVDKATNDIRRRWPVFSRVDRVKESAKAEPGSTLLHPAGGSGISIAELFMHYRPGGAFGLDDSVKKRASWFSNGLAALAQTLSQKGGGMLVIPYKIGCDNDPLLWPRLRERLDKLACLFRMVRFIVAQRSDQHIYEQRTRYVEEAASTAADARAFVQRLPKGVTRTAGEMLVNALHEKQLEQLKPQHVHVKLRISAAAVVMAIKDPVDAKKPVRLSLDVGADGLVAAEVRTRPGVARRPTPVGNRGSKKVPLQCALSLVSRAQPYSPSDDTDATPVHMASTFAEAVDNFCEAYSTQNSEARKKLEASNRAVDDAFRDHIKRRLQDGEVTVAELREAQTPQVATVLRRGTTAWKGRRVVLAGCTLAHANGATGLLSAYRTDTDRYVVDLDAPLTDARGVRRTGVHVKAANILCTSDAGAEVLAALPAL